MSYTIEVKYSSSGNTPVGQQWQDMPGSLIGQPRSASSDILSNFDFYGRRNTCSNLLGNMDLTTSLLHNSNIVKARSMNNMESNFDCVTATTMSSDKMNKSEERMSQSNMMQRVDRQISLGEKSTMKSSSSSSEAFRSEFSSTSNYQRNTKQEEFSSGVTIRTTPSQKQFVKIDEADIGNLSINSFDSKQKLQTSIPIISTSTSERKSSHTENKSSVQRTQQRTTQNTFHNTHKSTLQSFPEHEESYNAQLSIDSGIEDSYETPIPTPVHSLEQNPLAKFSRPISGSAATKLPKYPEKKNKTSKPQRPFSNEPVLKKPITVEKVRPKTAQLSHCPPLPARPAKKECEEESEPVYSEIDEIQAEKEKEMRLQQNYPDYRTQESLHAEKQDALTGSTEITDTTSLPTIKKSADNMLDVYVLVVDSYTKRGDKELTLKPGMKIKQKEPANSEGYAYGWFRSSKLGKKTYGCYPVDKVIYLPRS